MAKKSNARINVKLVSSEKTGVFYTTSVNQRNNEGKLKLKKYDKKLFSTFRHCLITIK